MNKLIATIFVCLFTMFFVRSVSADPAEAYLFCKQEFFDSNDDADTGHPNTHRNLKISVDKGEWITWAVRAPKNSVLVIKFMKKKDYQNKDTMDVSPFSDGTNPITIPLRHGKMERVQWGPISNTAKDGLYGYEITCKYPDGGYNTIDPMIEIPKRTIVPTETKQ